MSFKEYRERIINRLNRDIKDKEYIKNLEDDIKKSYKSEIRASEILESDQVSPSGYCYGIMLLYPDYPD